MNLTKHKNQCTLNKGGKMNPLDLLFKDSDFVCVSSDCYETRLSKYSDAKHFKTREFFSINPFVAGTSRKDANVKEFRNFLFEIDTLDLDSQLKIFEGCKVPFALITFSGNKSYHAIVSLMNSLDANPSDANSVYIYKSIWSQIAKVIDNYAVSIGFTLPETGSFLDQSCKNPSRFSRFPGVFRESTQKVQKLHSQGTLMDEETLNSIVSTTNIKLPDFGEINDYDIQSLDEFKRLMPDGLKYQTFTPSRWASSSNMYPILFKLTLWAIDSTGVPKGIWVAYLESKVFDALRRAGYPEEKFMTAINHAYGIKGVN